MPADPFQGAQRLLDRAGTEDRRSSQAPEVLRFSAPGGAGG
jgi:hypothetical protein